MKFGPKLFLVLSSVIAVLVASAFAASGEVLTRAYQPVSITAITSAGHVIEDTLKDRDSKMELQLRPLVNDARIKAGLFAHAGVADPERLGGATTEERQQNANDYLGSFVDEYWIEDNDQPAQDLLMLVGADRALLYGEAGDEEHVPLEKDVVGHQQLQVLLREAFKDERGARMLWSGPRLRSDAPVLPGMNRGLYLAGARRATFHTSGIGDDEVVGAAVVADHRLRLERVLATRADAVFIDRGQAIASTFALRDAGGGFEGHAAAWLAGKPDGGIHAIVLGETGYYAKRLELPGLVKGPVDGAIFYSREEELSTIGLARSRLGVAGLGLALIAVFVAMQLSRGLARPIAVIASAADRVAKGDLDVQIPGDRKDELGDLGRRFNEMVRGLKERALAKDALGRYLSPEMAADVVSGAKGISMQGERRALSILFCDVAGFTTISEKLEPEALVALLNQYLDQMVKLLIARGAYVDKFEGDAIMAFWNAPRPQAGHAEQACLAVLEMRAAAKALSAEWVAAGKPAFGVRYGLNTGIAIVGNMGATDKINYTAIGDNVNLASRLEGANKTYGTETMIAEETYLQAKDAIEARELDLIKVKGKERPVRVYELIAVRGTLSADQQRAREAFGNALMLYRDRRFGEAKSCFDALSASDGPARVFASRCARFLETPPPADWDGTYEMQTK